MANHQTSTQSSHDQLSIASHNYKLNKTTAEYSMVDSKEDESWDTMFSRLERYKAENGCCDVKDCEDSSLAAWVLAQRPLCRHVLKSTNKTSEKSTISCCEEENSGQEDRSVLLVERAVKLKRLGLLCDIKAENDAKWEMRLAELQKYKLKHLDCLVPARYDDNPQLGHWVMTQRRQYNLLKQGKRSTLTEERIRSLEKVGFVWVTREDSERVWYHRLKQLQEYKAKYGDCLVPQRYSVNPKLGIWVNTQRRHFKLLKEGMRSSMTPERISELEAIGFCWKSPKLGTIESQQAVFRKRQVDAATADQIKEIQTIASSTLTHSCSTPIVVPLAESRRRVQPTPTNFTVLGDVQDTLSAPQDNVNYIVGGILPYNRDKVYHFSNRFYGMAPALHLPTVAHVSYEVRSTPRREPAQFPNAWERNIYGLGRFQTFEDACIHEARFLGVRAATHTIYEGNRTKIDNRSKVGLCVLPNTYHVRKSSGGLLDTTPTSKYQQMPTPVQSAKEAFDKLST